MNCAEGSNISHIIVDSAQVGAVEDIQEIEAELQVALLTDPWDLVVLEHTGVNLEISRVAVDISGQAAFLPGCWRSEVSQREYAVLELLAAVRAGEVGCWSFRNVVTKAVVIVVAAESATADHPERGTALDRCDAGQLPPRS